MSNTAKAEVPGSSTTLNLESLRRNLSETPPNGAESLFMMVCSIVDTPDEVRLEITRSQHSCIVVVHVAKSDIGKVIGKKGAHAQAMRLLLAASGGKERVRYTLDIHEQFQSS